MNGIEVGTRVAVRDQDITGTVVRFDGSKLVVLDDDRADWMEDSDDGTLVFRVEEIEVAS